MGKRLVMVVHQMFAYKGKHVERGTVITDPDEIAFVRKNHPEKVTASMHDFDDDPAPAEDAAPAIEADHGESPHADP